MTWGPSRDVGTHCVSTFIFFYWLGSLWQPLELYGKEVLTFGKHTGDSTLIIFTKFHVCACSMTTQSWTYVYARNFWTVSCQPNLCGRQIEFNKKTFTFSLSTNLVESSSNLAQTNQTKPHDSLSDGCFILKTIPPYSPLNSAKQEVTSYFGQSLVNSRRTCCEC